MSDKPKWKGKRKPKKAPKLPDGFVRTPRGPKVKKPHLYLKNAKAPKGWPKDEPYGTYYIYHHKKDYSTGFDQDHKEEADAE